MLKEQVMNELVSIIVPIYNVENYLLECLESLIVQTHNNIEIILIDDGSTDRSNEIARQFIDLHTDKSIKLIEKENGGQSSARNLGMQQAEGMYIIFIDSDDLVSATHVEMLYKAVKEKNAKLAMCKMTKKRSELSKGIPNSNTFLQGNFLELVNQLYASNYPSTAAWCKIYHQVLLKKAKFQEGMIYEDGLFFYEIIHQVNEIVLIDAMSYFYRTVENSTMTSKITEKNFDILKQNELVYLFFKQYHPEALNHFYRKALNVNDYTAVKCLQDNSFLSKDLFKKLYLQNKSYIKTFSLRNSIYLSRGTYYSFVFIVSKVFKTNQPDKESFIKKIIKKITS